jgi:hypothetical protein
MSSKYEKRPSPPVSAQDFPNHIKIGNDGNEYVSRPDTKKIYRWYKVKSMDDSTSAEKYFMQFPKYYMQKKFYKFDIKKFEENIKSVKKELAAKNIYLIKLGWKKIWDFIDYAWEDAQFYIKDKYYKHDKKINNYNILDVANFIFYTDYRTFWAQHDGILSMQWNLNKNAKKEAFEIFKKKFKNNFVEPKSSSKAIIINLKKL